MHPLPLLLAATLAAGAAQAQQVWRCGNSYQGEPCAGGIPVSVAPAVTAGGPQEARASARYDAEAAAALEKARLDQEKSAPRAIVIAPPIEETAKPAEPKKKPQKPAAPFTAVAPRK